MKTLMNCDNAFEALTAGPVELSVAATELVDHLESCESCRNLAEALRPATHLLHESLPDPSDLPIVLAEDDEAVLKVMRQVGEAVRPPSKGYVRSATAAGLATVACTLLVWIGPWWSQGNVASQDLHQQLTGFGLPQACYETVKRTESRQMNCSDCHLAKPDHQDQETDCTLTLACCTSCHAASESPPAPRVKVPQLLAACGSCHMPAH